MACERTTFTPVKLDVGVKPVRTAVAVLETLATLKKLSINTFAPEPTAFDKGGKIVASVALTTSVIIPLYSIPSSPPPAIRIL